MLCYNSIRNRCLPTVFAMMHLLDLIKRALPPQPWQEGDNIPWHEPQFSARMLNEHLSQEHDAASRRQTIIERHVDWIHTTILQRRPSRILDLGCGPGLYSNRLAVLGHQCNGIDYSPASIAYARQTGAGLDCSYHCEDLRTADFGTGFNLALCIFGELNVFAPHHARLLLAKVYAALMPGGQLVLEVHTAAAIEALGTQAPTWFTAPTGLFSEQPHLVLSEHIPHPEAHAVTIRHYVVDLASSLVTRYAQTMQQYTDDDYRQLLEACGFDAIRFFPALSGADQPDQPALYVIVAQK